jgi:2,3,4,5-tetrahydropyridine-2,6-dicarboxylate N-succinyltransferase
MASEQGLSAFKERLGNLPSIDNVAVGRVYDVSGNLLTIVPNLPGKSGSLKAFNGVVNYDGNINLQQALEIFGQEFIDEAIGNVHPNIQLVQKALQEGRDLRLDLVHTQSNGLLEAIIGGNATPEQKLEGLKLLQSGDFRTAEKTYGVNGDKPLWEPQAYSIAALNAGFGLFSMGTFSGMPQYVDKIPLWSQKVNLEDGVHSPFMSEEELVATGVRLIPGSFARIGAYLGRGTTIMPGGIVNIGAYIVGEGVMVDGGARVASGAQVGKGVKIGAGTGLEGVLEPAGMMPTIVEDGVRIGANCEVTGIIGEGSLIGSGVVMAAGKKIYDERTNDFVEPLYVNTAAGIKAVPYIPAGRIAVGGSYTPKGSRVGKDVVVLLEKKAIDSSFMEVPKNAPLYQR